ncbi:zinc finger protein 93-like [Maniola jurtina]|uniref:zinc finger protein 93-like n=1 Tax=Maniola jurtina TaxID=191418 RepID=UPI001E6888AC|nr:zinc finger protein 93-like [Maniola jurtina]
MHECSYCAKKFKYESEKKRHELSHIPQFECKECCKKFSFISALKRHQKQHERTCSVICSDCGRSFRDEPLLKRHIKYAHKGIHVCSKCSSTFHSDLALSSHMKSHKPKCERRFKCKYSGCNKSFNFSHHLKHHELTHTNQKQHSCKICGKGFIQLHHLKTHLKSHELDDLNPISSVLDCNHTILTEVPKKRRFAANKTTNDSGISSDSNCDISQDSTKGSKLCATCGQMIKSSLYETHKEKCISTEEIPEDLSLKLLPSIEFNNNNTTVKSELNCESILGACIVSGDSPGSNCLCAQIKIDVDFHDIASPIEPFNVKNQLQPIESLCDKGITRNNCGCECSSKKVCNLSTNMRHCDKKDFPEIEYRNDGVIKIKDTFDFDVIDTITPTKEVETDEQYDSFKLNNFVPYNSCQAVLGRCIVSGNGTMSEECLCAKMAMDDQTDIAQEEIDEITPHPNISSGQNVICD